MLPTSREVGYRHLEGVALRLLGESLVATDSPAARQHLKTAQEILVAIDARNDVAKTLVARAALARVTGAPARAPECLEEALTIFEALGTLDEPRRVRTALAELAAAG